MSEREMDADKLTQDSESEELPSLSYILRRRIPPHRWSAAEKNPIELFEALRACMFPRIWSDEQVLKIFTRYGENEQNVLKAQEIIKRQHEARSDDEKQSALGKKLIIPPGLWDMITSIERDFAESEYDPILILGPTGIGKSLFFHYIKGLFRDKHQNEEIVRPIVEANCGDFAGTGIDMNVSRSELFGHVEGAFSGAIKDKKGLIEEANGGLLILDEIGELSFESQSLFLKFVETGKYRRVGDTETREAKVKIVGATNKEKQLREEFGYRFFPYRIPAVHERRADILYYLYEKFPGLTKSLSRHDVLQLLCYHWPGNVREIERVAKLLTHYERVIEDGVEVKSGPVYCVGVENLNRKDISFDPSALDIRSILLHFDVDVPFLEKLLNKYRLSLNEDDKTPAFNELREKSPDFSYYASYWLKFCDEYQPFEEAYKGYLCFCGLFLQDPKKNGNISNFHDDMDIRYQDTSHLDYSKSDQTRVQKLIRKIMGYLSLVEVSKNTVPEDLGLIDYWNALRELREKSYSSNQEEKELECLADMKEKDLLKLYYEKLLERTHGHIKKASTMAGLPESTFRDKMAAAGVKFLKKDLKTDRE